MISSDVIGECNAASLSILQFVWHGLRHECIYRKFKLLHHLHLQTGSEHRKSSIVVLTEGDNYHMWRE